MAYGIQIFNANGTAEIFGLNASGSHFITQGSTGSVGGGQTSSAISCEGMAGNNADTVEVSVATTTTANPPTVNRGSGSFTITNGGSGAATYTFYAFRY
tara:strand:- start:1230 stop:1526 length:297 start_codon:yes stop_codon:yes gene_type:complete